MIFVLSAPLVSDPDVGDGAMRVDAPPGVPYSLLGRNKRDKIEIVMVQCSLRAMEEHAIPKGYRYRRLANGRAKMRRNPNMRRRAHRAADAHRP